MRRPRKRRPPRLSAEQRRQPEKPGVAKVQHLVIEHPDGRRETVIYEAHWQALLAREPHVAE
jgi:hypothetical protein